MIHASPIQVIGGGKRGEPLQQVCEGLRMRPLATRPGLKLARERIEANSGAINLATEFAEHLSDPRQAFGELANLLGESSSRRLA